MLHEVREGGTDCIIHKILVDHCNMCENIKWVFVPIHRALTGP